MNHIKKVMCICCVLYTVTLHKSPAFGAFEYLGLGWPAATANIKVVGFHPDRYAFNSALLSETAQPHLTLSYQKPFQSLDLQAGALTILSSIRQKPYICSLEYFGDELYSELIVNGGSAFTIQKDFSLGLRLNYQRLALSGFSSQHSMTLSFSSYAELTEQFKLGSVVEHVIQIGDKLSIPQKFQIGALYKVGPSELLFALEKESALPLEVCLGLLISADSFWEIGLGYRDVSGMISAGWRIHTERIALHYVCVLHPQLPVSNGFGLELILP